VGKGWKGESYATNHPGLSRCMHHRLLGYPEVQQFGLARYICRT